MRTAFIETLCELAEKDDRIWLLCGDLGYSVLEVFARRFPQRYLNCGVAEQNMTGIAAGLALSGNVVFTYSIANFPVMRCMEQIRNDVCYHNLNVKIVAVGGGLAYGPAGYTHHAVEDIAMMRVLPNMVVVAPGDPIETRLAVRAMVDWNGPCYLRLGKAGEPVVHTGAPSFAIGKAIMLLPGSDITLISTGGMLATAQTAALTLISKGYSTGLISMHTIEPLDIETIQEAARKTGRIITIEEHGSGGLASATGEAIAASGIASQFTSLRLPRAGISVAGSQNELLAKYLLSAEGIVNTALAMLSKHFQ